MKVLITGPCGSGKTTLIEELDKRGYKTSSELEKRFWFDKDKVADFEHGIMNNRIKVYEDLKESELIFFDRGVIDPLVYRKYEGKEISLEFDKIAKRYRYDFVFVVEPLDSHNPNPEHDHMIKTPEDARRWFELMLETLKDYGYKPIVLKNMSVQKRIEFILKMVSPASIREGF